jgi:hypothetical protein
LKNYSKMKKGRHGTYAERGRGFFDKFGDILFSSNKVDELTP